MASKTFTVSRIWKEHWDGSDETAGEFGYGDFVRTHIDEICRFESDGESMRRVQAEARRLLKASWDGPIWFSGACPNFLIEEV